MKLRLTGALVLSLMAAMISPAGGEAVGTDGAIEISPKREGEKTGASTLDPETRVQVYLLYADLLLAENADEVTRELDILTDILGLQPESAYAHARLAQAYLDAGILDEAIRAASDAARLGPTDFYAHHVLALAYRRIGDFPLARDHLEQALDLKPNAWETLDHLARVYELLGEFQKAAEAYLRLSQVRRIFADHYRYSAALDYIRLGERERAAALLEQVIEENPGHRHAYLRLAKIYRELERWRDAIRVYRQITALFPFGRGHFPFDDEVVAAHLNLSDLYFQLGETDKAVRELDWVVDNRPDYQPAQRDLGVLYLYRGEYDKAIQLLEDWVEDNPDRIDDAFHLARAYVGRAGKRIKREPEDAKKDFEKAAELFGRILDHTPDHEGALSGLLKVAPPEESPEILDRYSAAADYLESSTSERDNVMLLRLAGLRLAEAQAAYRAGQEERGAAAENKGIEWLEELLKLEPENMTALQGLAEYYRRTENWERAQAAYKRLIESDPEDWQPLYELGVVLVQTSQYEKAREVLERSLELAEETGSKAVILYSLAVALQNSGEEEEAERCLRQGLAFLPHNESFVYQLGVLMLNQNRLEDVKELLEAELEQNPDAVDLASLLSRCYQRVKDWQSAEQVLTRALEQSPESSRLRMDLASLYADTERVEEAVRIIEESIEENPEAWDYYLQLAFVYEKSKDYEKMEAIIDRILDRDPDNHAALNFLGYTWADRNVRLEEALEMIEKAVAAEPDNGMYVDSLGWVYFRLGRYEDAERELARAVELEEDPVILDHYGDALDRAGKTQQAIEMWEKALRLDPEKAEIRKKIEERESGEDKETETP